MLHIRQEAPEDRAVICRVVTQAFGQPDEADLLDRLRAALPGAAYLGFVAEQDGEIVGHVAFTPVTLDGASRRVDVRGLAPMAVLPAFQRSGIGRALARRGLDGCRESGAAAVVVLGDPAYYGRFGFRPAAEFGLACAYDAPPEAFMALEVAADALRGASGTVRYHPAFG